MEGEGEGGSSRVTREKKETIIPVVLLCAVDGLGKVKEKLTTRKMPSSCESVCIALFSLLSPLPLTVVHSTCYYSAL